MAPSNSEMASWRLELREHCSTFGKCPSVPFASSLCGLLNNPARWASGSGGKTRRDYLCFAETESQRDEGSDRADTRSLTLGSPIPWPGLSHTRLLLLLGEEDDLATAHTHACPQGCPARTPQGFGEQAFLHGWVSSGCVPSQAEW